MSGFTKIPGEIYVLFQDPLELACAVRIYKHADDSRWKSFRGSRRYLSVMCSVPDSVVARVVDELEMAGLVKVVKSTTAGGRSRANRLLVHEPTGKKPKSQTTPETTRETTPETTTQTTELPDEGEEIKVADHSSNHSSNHNPNQITRPQTHTPDSDSDSDSDTLMSNPAGVDPPESDQAGEGKASSKTAARRQAFGRCADEWQSAKPGGLRPSMSKGQGKSMSARITDWGADAVVEVIRWAATSSHSRAEFLRERGLSLKTLMRASNFEEYLGFAKESSSSSQAVSLRLVTVQEAVEAEERAARDDTYRPAPRRAPGKHNRRRHHERVLAMCEA